MNQMRLHIRRTARAAGYRLLAVTCVAAAVAASAAAPSTGAAAAAVALANGDFETGDFGGWTLFTTDNGAIIPSVTPFDTGGDGTSSLAAQLVVGQAVFEGFDVQRGGGIAQTIDLGTGDLTISAAVASEFAFPFCNGDGGTLQLLVDAMVVDQRAFGEICGPTVTRAALGGTVAIADSGTHEVRVLATRAATLSGVTLYVDDVVVSGSATEPATLARLVEVLDGYELGARGAGLRATLAVAVRLEAQGRREATCAALESFLHQSTATAGAVLSVEQAEEVTRLAQRVRQTLGC